MQKNLVLQIGEPSSTDNYQIIKFNGEFDKAGHSEIKEGLDNVVKSFGGKNLIFDFESLKFINSEGIGYLMEIHAHLIKSDKRLVIVGLQHNVKDVFETIGISEIIPIYTNLDEFLSSR